MKHKIDKDHKDPFSNEISIEWHSRESEEANLDLNGSLTNCVIQKFRKEIEHFLAEFDKDLVLNVKELIHVDSIGIGVLIFFHTQFQGKGKKLVFNSPSKDICELFRLTSLDRVLHIV